MSPLPPTPYGSGPDASILAACSICQTAFQPLTAHILGAREDSHLLYFQCPRCGTGTVALVTAGPVGLSAIGAMTDLVPAEIMAWPEHQSVTDDDVIDFAAFLGKESGLVAAFQRLS